MHIVFQFINHNGSEWNNVVVFDESFIFEDSKNWLYTAITRAKQNLVILK